MPPSKNGWHISHKNQSRRAKNQGKSPVRQINCARVALAKFDILKSEFVDFSMCTGHHFRRSAYSEHATGSTDPARSLNSDQPSAGRDIKNGLTLLQARRFSVIPLKSPLSLSTWTQHSTCSKQTASRIGRLRGPYHSSGVTS